MSYVHSERLDEGDAGEGGQNQCFPAKTSGQWEPKVLWTQNLGRSGELWAVTRGCKTRQTASAQRGWKELPRQQRYWPAPGPAQKRLRLSATQPDPRKEGSEGGNLAIFFFFFWSYLVTQSFLCLEVIFSSLCSNYICCLQVWKLFGLLWDPL